MPKLLPSSPLCENHLLSLLSDEDYQALTPHLKTVELSAKQVIAERDQPIAHIYFPCSAVLSVLAQMLNGTSVEVGTIGNEGFYGISVLVGGGRAIETTICQVPGKALRMSTAGFAEAISGNVLLREVLLRYVQAYLSMVSQSVACSRLHSVEARFARWILMTHDRVPGDDFYLTQEFLAEMLGVHRPSASIAAESYQQAGMIRYNRGHMTILRRDALEEMACECYGIVQAQFKRMIGPMRKKTHDTREEIQQ